MTYNVFSGTLNLTQSFVCIVVEPEDSVDDIRPVAPIHREHLSLPDGYRPIADSKNVNG